MNIPKDSLDLRGIHDTIHSLVLSRRHGVGLWNGLFESCWAGYVLALHSPENRSDEIINSLKGEVLGEGRLTKVNDDYSLATSFMVAAFLNKIGLVSEAELFIEMAEEYVVKYTFTFNPSEKFQFLSTPEYVYAASLAFEAQPSRLSLNTVAALRDATANLHEDKGDASHYRFALMGTAALKLHGFETNLLFNLAQAINAFTPQIEEDNIAMLWFLDANWHQMRVPLVSVAPGLVSQVDVRLPELRTKIFRLFPNFTLEPVDYRQFNAQSETEKLDHVADARVVTTIELLMLDEIAERHSVSSLVITREELENRHLIPSAINAYQKRVEGGLEKLGLPNELEAVYSNLQGGSPSHWSSAVFACRRILYELSDRLLNVNEDEYPYILDKSGKNPMSIKKDREKNRLVAYMHQMGIRTGSLISAQLEFLWNVLHELVSQTSGEGKRSNLDYDTALSIVLNTYFFLGELIRLTDFKVIDHLSPPVTGIVS